MVLTRRAHRERMEIFRWLPNEILVGIIQHSPKADQATLSRVSKLFRDLCLPVLYRAVKISSDSVILASIAVISFCSGMIETPARADAVRSFYLRVPYDYSNIEIRCGLILPTLKLMSRLNHLSIFGSALNNRHWNMLLEECNFPQLINCDLRVPYDLIYYNPTRVSNLVAGFLNRHSTLKRVHLPSYRIIAPQPVRVSLPDLEFYHGGAAFIAGIDAICLKEVQLAWNYTDDDNVDEIITSLSSMTKPYLPFISCHANLGRLCHQIMDSVSMRMPHTKTLRLHPLKNYGALLGQDTIRHVTECLPRFTGLLYLAMEWCRDVLLTSGANKDEDRIAVEGWGEACPTLEACCLNHYGWRKVAGRWEEYPITQFWALAGLSDLGY
ncbi:hypothetical protein MSAN_02117000 [Mycena sanguinolenta]|uniref:F-box domain-containing protein n=1 Tax=Mycena sanguinolenta TaxID=230812 RepID=A0A8H6XG77_9AGAR|nr:hypothetical protein MSAN_02117000 [Mycena sanguinolenta]